MPKSSNSSLLTPYKALGIVCTDVPPVFHTNPRIKRLGDLNAAVGNVIVTYRLNPFRRYKVSDPVPGTITKLARDKVFVFAAFDTKVAVFRFNETLVKTIDVDCAVKFMLSFIDTLVIVDAQNTLRVIDVEEGIEVIEIPLPDDFNASCLVHPATYINKVLIGGENGEMLLINIKTGKIIFKFERKAIFDSPITVIEQSTAVDVVAVGHENGRIQLRNLKTDEVLHGFKHDFAVAAISFRTDGIEIMATAAVDGTIALWNLETQMLIGQLPNVHSLPVTALHFVRGMPYLISTGEDNRMIRWLVEDEASLPQRNTELCGHSAPALCIQFCGENSLVTTSLDRHVRSFNIIRDDVMVNLGLAREVKKSEVSKDRFVDVPLEPIVEIDVGLTREAVWENVVCRHDKSPIVSLWSTRRKTKGEKLLYHPRFAVNPEYTMHYATSVSLSACGNYAFVGSSSGHVDQFNVQSGQFRATFAFVEPGVDPASLAADDKRAHTAPVTGVTSDLAVQQLITAASDGVVRFWQLKPPKAEKQCRVPGSITRIKLNRFNSLLAVGLTNGGLGLIECVFGRVARKWPVAHEGCEVTALEFSRDGKWLLSADSNGRLKIWDVMSGFQIEDIRFPKPCIAMAFNGAGQFLTTAHAGERAIYVWANNALFAAEDALTHPSHEKANLPIHELYLPGVTTFDKPRADDNEQTDGEDVEINAFEDEEGLSDEENENVIYELEKMELDDYAADDSELYKVSDLPPARWVNLADIDAIRSRNKPIEPPKKPKHAPFFLPTTESLEGVEFVVEDAGGDREKTVAAKRKLLELETPFSVELKSQKDPKSLLESFNKLKSMSLTAVDFQIRSLSSGAVAPFLRMMKEVVKSRRDLDLAQSYLNAFFRVQRAQLWNVEEDDEAMSKEVSRELKELKEAFEEPDLVELQLNIGENLTTLQWLKTAVIQLC